MYRKMEAGRREAFLGALEACGNQTLAAERAGVSRSWVCKERKLERRFDRACRAAVDAAGARLAAGRGRRPADAAEGGGGRRLTVRRGIGGRTQVRRCFEGEWSPADEAAFLAALEQTRNVRIAAEAAGKSWGSAHVHRRRSPDFAARWVEAKRRGLAVLARRILERQESDDWYPKREPAVAMTVEQAIHALHMGKWHQFGIGKRPGRLARVRTLEEVAPAILARLRTFVALRAALAEDEARREGKGG